jgi:anti-sigma factor RsiW
MNCADYRDAIVDLARGALPTAGETRLLAHVSECPICAAQLAGERSLSAALRGLAEDAAAESAPDALEERLVRVFVSEKAPALPVPGGARIRWWLPLAAGLVLAAGAVGWWRSGDVEPRTVPSPSPPPSTQASKPAAAPGPETSFTPLPVPIERGAPGKPAKPSVRRQPHVLRPAGFMAIPAASGLPDFESGEIVRVEIPLTSLPSYGIEIVPDAKRTPVQADLLVGQDGQARAIRLVRSTTVDRTVTP